MSDRPLKILLIDPDPIFRLGLRQALSTFDHLEVVSEVENYTEALQTLAQLAQNDLHAVNLVVVEIAGRGSDPQLGLQFCRQLKNQYPNLPVLLLTYTQEPGLLLAARSTGIDGYYPKGNPISELVSVMPEVGRGGFYWYKLEPAQLENRSREVAIPLRSQRLLPIFLKLRNNFHLSGIDNINTALTQVTAQLKVPGLPLLDRAILAGQRRELLAARWLLDRIWGSIPVPQSDNRNYTTEFPEQTPQVTNTIPTSNTIQVTPSLVSPRGLQAALFSTCINKLQFPLQNVTAITLEIDILREEKKRELLYLILQKLADALDELRKSQIELNQLDELRNVVLLDIWQQATLDFFGKFSRVRVGKDNLEIVSLLLPNDETVRIEIINLIPGIEDLFAHLLFQTDLRVDNELSPAGSYEAMERASMLLENLLIQVANAVMQPLLNYLADVEEIKQNYYDRSLISTREIERFRNNLSWKYRWRNYIGEAQAVFESRYDLFVFAPRGIAIVSTYSPRNQDLAKLSGIPLFVTLLLEFRDASAPRLQSLLSFLGSGVVFILTRIVGRGLGLIVRGVLQGIGSVSFPEKKNKNY